MHACMYVMHNELYIYIYFILLYNIHTYVIRTTGFHTGFFAGGGEVIVKVVVVYVSY